MSGNALAGGRLTIGSHVISIRCWTRWLLLALLGAASLYFVAPGAYDESATPPEAIIHLEPPADYVPPKAKGKVRLGIVLKTRRPIAIHDWLRHHQRLGVERVYMRIEDTPGLAADLRQSEFAHLVNVSEAPPPKPNEGKYKNLIQGTNNNEQNAHADLAIAEAKREGLTHLAHIDDDELLYFPSGKEAFYAELSQYDENSGISNLRMANLEAVYDYSNCISPFNTTTHFRFALCDFTAYHWGKSIGNLGDPFLEQNGVHKFKGESVDLKNHTAVVLHYEGACVQRWKLKFNQGPEKSKESIRKCNEDWQGGFVYYCESMEAFVLHPESDNAEVWRKYKLRENNRPEALVVIDPKKIW